MHRARFHAKPLDVPLLTFELNFWGPGPGQPLAEVPAEQQRSLHISSATDSQ